MYRIQERPGICRANIFRPVTRAFRWIFFTRYLNFVDIVLLHLFSMLQIDTIFYTCHVSCAIFLVFGESETTNLKCSEKSLMKWVPDYSNRELSCDRLAAWWGIGTTGPTSESVLPDHIACVGNIMLHHEIILIESSGSWKRLFNCTGSEKWFYFRIERKQIVFLSYRCIANILCCIITDLKQNLTGHLDPMMMSE